MVDNCIFAHIAMCYHNIVYLHTMHGLQKHYFNYDNVCNSWFDHLHFRLHPFALKNIIEQRNTQNKQNIACLGSLTSSSCIFFNKNSQFS